MCDTTDEKLAKLVTLFPDYEKEALLDILVSCNGSIREVTLLIDGDYSKLKEIESQRKRLKTKSQQTLLSCFSSSSTISAGTLPRGSSGKPINLYTKSDIESTLRYCTYHPNIFPDQLAESLLKMGLEDDAAAPNEFYLFGNRCVSNHKTRIYSNQPNGSSMNYNGKKVKNVGAYTDELAMAQVIIEETVNTALGQRKVLPFQVKPGNWNVQTVLCNIYGRESNLDWHSDRLTHIGAHAVIASVSLGFSREFRVRKVYPTNSQVYSIHPSHNSLLIMHAGFQEEYKHCVPFLPKRRAIPADEMHPISGTSRVNLTYRNYTMGQNPTCEKCGYPMELRRAFKDPKKRGKYLWQCAKSYTDQNGFKEGNECRGTRFARLNCDPPYTNDERLCSTWLADDDYEAKQIQH